MIQCVYTERTDSLDVFDGAVRRMGFPAANALPRGHYRIARIEEISGVCRLILADIQEREVHALIEGGKAERSGEHIAIYTLALPIGQLSGADQRVGSIQMIPVPFGVGLTRDDMQMLASYIGPVIRSGLISILSVR